MREKILKELSNYSDKSFADWLKPFLNINKNSTEILLGIRVPQLRKLAKKYKSLDIKYLKEILTDNIHELRALAIFIMLLRVKQEPKVIYNLYLNNLEYINNWDLIDYSAPHIIAPFATKKELRKLANSDYLWANRIAMVSTIYFIKQNDFDLALEFAEKFIEHPHHLMHKASGWMLREIGKKDVNILKNFLKQHSKKMPSIMRSYATERLKSFKLVP